MTEDEARRWACAVSRGTSAKLEMFATMVEAESRCQNLVSAATLPHIWARHIVDSLQLGMLDMSEGRWLDIGSGAGFPGIVIACFGYDITLVEPRRKRVDFLDHAVECLGLCHHTTIFAGRLEAMPPDKFAVITARAVAPLDKLFNLAHRFATPETRWLLPKGRGASTELATARAWWQGSFEIVPSVTDPESGIIVASDVRPRRPSR